MAYVCHGFARATEVYGKDPDIAKVASIASAAQRASASIDEDRSKLYCDLIYLSISEAARRALQAVDMSKYEYQSDFARKYVAQGRTEGRADLIVRQLTVRFGTVSENVRTRLARASLSQLDAIGERLLTARTLEEALA